MRVVDLMKLRLGLLAAACVAGVLGAQTALPEVAWFERAIHQRVRPTTTNFHLGHLKLSRLQGDAFTAAEPRHLAILEDMGLGDLFESRRARLKLFTTRPGRLLRLDEPFELGSHRLRLAYFELETEWQPWALTAGAEEVFDLPTPPSRGTLLFRQVGDEWTLESMPEARTGPAPAACQLPCEEPGRCQATSRADFPDIEDTLQEWTSDCGRGGRVSVAGGECPDGSHFLVRSHGFGSTMHFFDPSGRFTGISSQSDAIGPNCRGQTYWPDPPQCTAAVVTRSYCGFFPEGQVVQPSRWLGDSAD